MPQNIHTFALTDECADWSEVFNCIHIHVTNRHITYQVRYTGPDVGPGRGKLPGRSEV